jgi:hypothetical protein
MYTSGGATSTYQVAGIGHAEDGYYFAYKDTTFGILYNNRGVREVRMLTIATASSTTENVTVTLNSVAFTIAVTNSAVVNRTTWELSIGTYSGWSAEQRSNTVYFIADAVGSKSGTYSVSGTSIVGTFSSVSVGAAVTETFIAQSAWNIDVMDGSASASNPTAILLDPGKFNVYEISMQYLGVGTMVFKIEVAPAGGNNATWAAVHIIRNPNALTASHVGNPSMPFTMSAYKAASSATDLTVRCCSVFGGIEGQLIRNGPLITYTGYTAGLTTARTALFIIRNSLYYGGRTNQSVIVLNSLTAAARGGNNVLTTVQLIRNATIAGNPNFAEYSSGHSCALFANTASMTCSYTNNHQLVFSVAIGEVGETTFNFLSTMEEIELQPGEWLVVSAYTNTSTAYISVGLNTREDR